MDRNVEWNGLQRAKRWQQKCETPNDVSIILALKIRSSIISDRIVLSAFMWSIHICCIDVYIMCREGKTRSFNYFDINKILLVVFSPQLVCVIFCSLFGIKYFQLHTAAQSVYMVIYGWVCVSNNKSRDVYDDMIGLNRTHLFRIKFVEFFAAPSIFRTTSLMQNAPMYHDEHNVPEWEK